MMKNYDQSDEINLNWTYIPDHPYRTFIIGGSRSTKFNMLLNLIKNQQPDIDEDNLCVKDPFESKYQLLINGRGKREILKIKCIVCLLNVRRNSMNKEKND